MTTEKLKLANQLENEIDYLSRRIKNIKESLLEISLTEQCFIDKDNIDVRLDRSKITVCKDRFIKYLGDELIELNNDLKEKQTKFHEL